MKWATPLGWRDAWRSRYLTVRQLLVLRIIFWGLSTATLAARASWQSDTIGHMFHYLTVWWNVVAWIAVSVTLVDYALRPKHQDPMHAPVNASPGAWLRWERWSEWLLVGHWTAALVVCSFFWFAVIWQIGQGGWANLPDVECSASGSQCWRSVLVTTFEHLVLPVLFLIQPLFSHLGFSRGALRCTFVFSMSYFVWSLYLAKARHENVYAPFLDLETDQDGWAALMLWGFNLLLNCGAYWATYYCCPKIEIARRRSDR